MDIEESIGSLRRRWLGAGEVVGSKSIAAPLSEGQARQKLKGTFPFSKGTSRVSLSTNKGQDFSSISHLNGLNTLACFVGFYTGVSLLYLPRAPTQAQRISVFQ